MDKNKKATINHINKKDNKCFQYAVAVALNYEEIKKDPQRVTKIKPFINQYNSEEKFEKNNVTIALNVLYAKKEKMYPAYLLKHNSNREKQVILLMIPNSEGYPYLAVKKLSELLKRITSKHHGDFYSLNSVHSFATESKLQSHKIVCQNKDFCDIIMPSEGTKILKFNQYQKSDKAPFIVYPDLECIIEKIDGSKNNPENSSTSKVNEHVPSGFSMSTISSLGSIENKHNMYRGKDCMKKFCEFLREHAMKIINLKKKK